MIHGPRKSCHSLAEEPISGSRSLTVLVSLPPRTPQCTDGTVPHTRPLGASPKESSHSAQPDISASLTQSIFSSSSFQVMFVRRGPPLFFQHNNIIYFNFMSRVGSHSLTMYSIFSSAILSSLECPQGSGRPRSDGGKQINPLFPL